MLEFIQLLQQRYQSVTSQLNHNNPLYLDYQERYEALRYAEAFIRKGQLIAEQSKFPLQIAVIGPTQAGKSSVVNLLLNDTQAGVSPLAGFTIHPQGFCHQLSVEAYEGLQPYFGRFERFEPAALSRSRYDCYALRHLQVKSSLLPECILWDTPDFDSIDAIDYREGVIRTLALADIIVLVVSKEKYADQSVWEVMKILASFRQPTVICLNKLNEGSEALVIESLKQKWLQCRPDPLPQIVALNYQKPPLMPVWPSGEGKALWDCVDRVERKQHLTHLQAMLKHHWSSWLEPVMSEHHAQRQWQKLVDQCLKQASVGYRRDYLDHPHHYHTFQAALVNLLTLLEIPGMARILGKTRRVMTWPVRKLMRLGQGRVSVNPHQEVAVLNQIGEHVLLQLADLVLEKTETEARLHHWWRDTASALRQKRAEWMPVYRLAVNHYHDDFRQDIDAAAHRLYHKLQEQPLILNSLRATRVTTDAGAMLLAIQTGGIGLHDLLLTPMMLTVTSLLAESALGGYMRRVEAELKQHQLQRVQTVLFEQFLRERLYALPQQVRSAHRFNISEQQLTQAEHWLQDKRHGLRIL